MADGDRVAQPTPGHAPNTLTTDADWFLAPETWEISHVVESQTALGIGKATLTKYVARVQSWYERWVNTGSNPFVHSRLYSANFPACVQIAYATLTSYIHRTPENTDAVLQTVEDRSNALLRENGAEMKHVETEEWIDETEQDIDLFGQLARLHALMTYQTIGLFDGDIRSRHVAEGHVGVQDSWASRLFRSAAKTLPNNHAIATHLIGLPPHASNVLHQQWYLWILAESIRRTWLVAVSVSTVFLTLQQRWPVCPGGVMYTNRVGLWSAASALDWEKQCIGRKFLQRFESSSGIENASPVDIDEFGTAILDMTCRQEWIEEWRHRSTILS